MANRKNKNKIADEVVECSNAANKRSRVEILNTTHGVPFTNPITQFPSFPILQQEQQRTPPQNTAAIGTNLQLFPPSPPRQQPQEQHAVDDAFVSTLIPQQNAIVGYYMNQMQLTLEEFWRRNVTEELKKVKEMERKLKEKEQQLDLFRRMYHHYEERVFRLEEALQKRVNGEGCSNTAAVISPEEEVQSCFIDLNTTQRMDMMCKHCRNRPATMLWLPCRHLCVCMVCERRVKNCPICKLKKTESLKINLPFN